MLKRFWPIVGLTGAVLFSASTATPGSEDAAAVLHRQTQELMDAITHGSAAVWDWRARYTGQGRSACSGSPFYIEMTQKYIRGHPGERSRRPGLVFLGSRRGSGDPFYI
jgi:hypothetical protein